MAEEDGTQSSDEPKGLDAVLERLDAIDTNATADRESRARLEGQVSALASAPAAPAEPASTEKTRYTRPQLKAAVENGDLLEDQADALMREQDQEDADSRMQGIADATADRFVMEGNLNNKKQAYIDAYPDCEVVGTEDRGKLLSAYKGLLVDGLPDNASTEVVAMRLAFGPTPGTLPADQTAQSRETDSTSGGSPEAVSARDDGSPLGKIKMTPGQRDGYERLIAKGVYTPEDVAKDLENYRPGGGRPRKMGNPRKGYDMSLGR